MTDAPEIPAVLTKDEVASLVGCNAQVLVRMQAPDAIGRDRYPQAAFKVGRSFRWKASDLVAFMSGPQ